MVTKKSYQHYKWDILVCNTCDRMLHLGWRFTPKDSEAAGSGEAFYALIVDYSEDKRRASEAAAERGLLQDLVVGVRAPAWLIALASSTLGAQVASQQQK
jgi:hypothetical protein